MAERDKDAPEMRERLVTPQERIQEQQRTAAREASRESDAPRDETIPGGRYLVGDELVDAEGTPLKGKG